MISKSEKKFIVSQSPETERECPTYTPPIFQKWREVLFVNYKVDPTKLSFYLPEGMEPDIFDDSAWISLVPFKMKDIEISPFPIPTFLGNIYEFNIRTYVRVNGVPSIYFLRIYSSGRIANFVARSFFGLPYYYAKFRDFKDDRGRKIVSVRNNKFLFEADFQVEEKPLEINEELRWLTDRYRLTKRRLGMNFFQENRHAPWEVFNVNMNSLSFFHEGHEEFVNGKPHSVFYSPGVDTVFWPDEKA